MIRIVCTAVAVYLGTVSSAYAQPAMPDGSALPTTVVDDGSGVAHAVWVAYQGYQPRALPKAASGPASSRELGFLQKCFYVQKHQARDATYYLLVEGAQPSPDGRLVATRHLGWVPEQYLVRGREALKAPRTGGAFGQPLHRKAIIINNLEGVAKDHGYKKTVVVRRAPHNDADGASELRLFTMFFIYSETESHVLLGANSAFVDRGAATPPGGAIHDVVLGWVPKDRAVEWNTREALFWDYKSTLRNDAIGGRSLRRTVAGKIWESPLDAYAARKDIWDGRWPADHALRSHAPQAIPIEENLDSQTGESPAPRYDEMRHVILEWDEKAGDELGDWPQFQQHLRAQRNDDHIAEGLWKLYRVGVLGGFVDEHGQPVAGAEKVRKYQQELERIQRQSQITEILFVIDDTQSMKPWFKHTADAIRKIASRVQGAANTEAIVRVGVAYYNDRDPDNPDHPGYRTPDRLYDAGSYDKRRDDASRADGIDKLIKNVESHVEYGGGGDPQEMLFAGLKAALEAADFERYSQKFVIVIGDCGDKGGGPTTAEIVDQLRTLSSDICFLAVHVPFPESIERDVDMQKFRDQMKAVVDGLNAIAVKPWSQYANITNADTLFSTIDDIYSRLSEAQKGVQKQLEEAKRGAKPPATKIAQMEQVYSADPEMRALIEQIKRQEGVQLFFKGYAWYYDGPDERERVKCCFRPYVLVTEAELDELIKTLEGLERAANQAGRTTPGEVAGATVMIQAGEWRDLRVATELEEAVGVRFRSAIFAAARDRAQKQNKPIAFTPQERNALLYKRYKLEDVKAQRERQYVRKVELLNGRSVHWWEPTSEGARLVSRLWKPPGIDAAFSWIWLDRVDEWP